MYNSYKSGRRGILRPPKGIQVDPGFLFNDHYQSRCFGDSDAAAAEFPDFAGTGCGFIHYNRIDTLRDVKCSAACAICIYKAEDFSIYIGSKCLGIAVVTQNFNLITVSMSQQRFADSQFD